MPKPVAPEDLVIPPQDNRICGIICVCQMTAVLSSVALVYLTVAIYMPTLRAFQSGISEVPEMCTTTRAWFRENCDWLTCGEWCLSKSSGACTQIYVNLRHNGSELLFTNCTQTTNKTCYGIDQENAKKARCIADECKNLTGTFNCSQGECINITDAFECVFNQKGPPTKCSGRRGKITCIDLEGLQNCVRGTCERILSPYNCDRRCLDIPTRNKNVIILSGDRVYLSQCERAFDKETNTEVWSEDDKNIVMVSCYFIQNTTLGVEATDCINGTLVDDLQYFGDKTNFTHLSYVSVTNTVLMDKNGIVAPPEQNLMIANESNLLINMEGCVNTLRDECRDFLREYGKDGTDHNARARFPCFYAHDDPSKVVARFDLAGTYQNFLVASILPSVLFVVSCFMLVFCQKTVEVGDDAKMRFRGCPSKGLSAAGSSEKASANNLGDGGGGEHSTPAREPGAPRVPPPGALRAAAAQRAPAPDPAPGRPAPAAPASQPASQAQRRPSRGRGLTRDANATTTTSLHGPSSTCHFDHVDAARQWTLLGVTIVTVTSCYHVLLLLQRTADFVGQRARARGRDRRLVREGHVERAQASPARAPARGSSLTAERAPPPAAAIDLDESKQIMGAQGLGEDGEDGEEGLPGEEDDDSQVDGPGALGVGVDPPFDLAALVDKAKFYTSLCLGTTAIVSVFAFLFLIPFVVDPVISSIMADFDPEPVTCVVVEHVYAEGLRNCSWASCREGCTASPNRCHQLLVNYSRVPFREWRTRLFNTSEPVPVVPPPPPTQGPTEMPKWHLLRRTTRTPLPTTPTPAPPTPRHGGEGEAGEEGDEGDGADEEAEDDEPEDMSPATLPLEYRRRLYEVPWDVAETKFLVNTEGCGYPPKVNCTEFAKKYGGRHILKPFPCYYSRAYPEQVVARYSWEENLRNLVLSLIVPNVLFGVSVGVLSYWYCPSCNRGGCGRHKKPFIEKENEDEDDDYEEEEEY
ncbi:Protein tipE [Gryllus bimaculatus]|nr:Protein tipE [Gryllus bimaculatus]